jgi:threonylcarbamoyladenosine tRNA methylthiotransferase MtaB
VRDAGATPGLARLRLSSVEVNHVSEELIDALRSTPTAGRHLHVPLQSGDDRVLSAMRRRYDAATYLRRIALAGDFNLTTDAIVGFPGEDEAAFEQTLRVVDEAGITKIHVFPYSPRPGTRTADVDSVSPAEKKRRSAVLRARSAVAEQARWHGMLGSTNTVLVDRPGRGYADDYVPWLVDAPLGELVRARAIAVTPEGIVGER